MYPSLEALRTLGGEAHRDKVNQTVMGSTGIRSMAETPGRSSEALLEDAKRRLGFALTKLKKVGAVESAGWGMWRLTDEGHAYLDGQDGEKVLRNREHELSVGRRPVDFFDRVVNAPGDEGLEMTVRSLLAEWDVKRRGSEVVARIQQDCHAPVERGRGCASCMGPLVGGR